MSQESQAAEARTGTPADIAARVAALDWPAIAPSSTLTAAPYRAAADARGMRRARRRAMPTDAPFRSRVIMARHGFGRGEYKYFAYPLPDRRGAARGALSAARRDRQPLERGDGHRRRYPAAHADLSRAATTPARRRPTPLLLQYGAGDYNCLHQDLYGEHVFPLQVAVLLSQPGEDFAGGEFVLTEQRPRMQSRAEVVPLRAGRGVVFAVQHRPVQGTRGVYRVNMRHGVSRIRTGQRHTLGIIFHDAK